MVLKWSYPSLGWLLPACSKGVNEHSVFSAADQCRVAWEEGWHPMRRCDGVSVPAITIRARVTGSPN